ncbi:hypothetical protein [Actinoplanes sp. GCM10030250]|uniref:hypothetical protein n=1 Tax=Actinoplanes sp. GCM10030250 TaxID=3273376 RepID=UPI00361FE46E
MRGEDARGAGLWPSIPAVLRVMIGWFFTGIGILNLAVELDGGLTPRYLVFHVVLLCGGLVLLTRQRLKPGRAGWLVAGVVVVAGTASGRPYPHGSAQHLVINLIFWGCAGLLLLTVVGVAERRLPERRTPVDLSGFAGHAEPQAVSATPDRSGENVGGLT